MVKRETNMDDCGHQHQGCTCQHHGHHHKHDDRHHHHERDRDWDVLDRLKDGVEDVVEDGVGLIDSIAEGFKAFMRDKVVPVAADWADVGVQAGIIAGIIATGAVAVGAVGLIFFPMSLPLLGVAFALPTIYAAQNYARGECGWVYRVANSFGTIAKGLVRNFGDNVLFAPCAKEAPEAEATPRAVPSPDVNSPETAEVPAPEASGPVVESAKPAAPETPAATLLPWQKAQATRAVNEHNLYSNAYERIINLDRANPRASSLEAKRIACTVIRDSLAQNDHRGRALHYGVKRDGLRAVATGNVRGIQNIQTFLAQEWAKSEVVREQRAGTGLGVAA